MSVKQKVNGQLVNIAGGSPTNASSVYYDNTTSGASANDVQEVIDEVISDLPKRTILTVTANGSKTAMVLLNELYALITDKSKIDNNSYISLVISGIESRYFISAIVQTEVVCFRSVISSDGFSTDTFSLKASNSTWLRSTGGTNRTDYSSTVLSSGTTISININAN